MRAFIGIVWAVLLCLGLSASVQAQAMRMAQANSRQALPDTDPDVATIYRGVLGEQRVQMVLMADEEQPGSYEGDYFVFGGGRNIQVAGEIDAERFYLEETEDGEHVSGSWDGKLVIEANRAYIVGTWRKGDESVAMPFKLERVLRARAYLKRST
jgi:hypothetical protein